MVDKSQELKLYVQLFELVHMLAEIFFDILFYGRVELLVEPLLKIWYFTCFTARDSPLRDWHLGITMRKLDPLLKTRI